MRSQLFIIVLATAIFAAAPGAEAQTQAAQKSQSKLKALKSCDHLSQRKEIREIDERIDQLNKKLKDQTAEVPRAIYIFTTICSSFMKKPQQAGAEMNRFLQQKASFEATMKEFSELVSDTIQKINRETPRLGKFGETKCREELIADSAAINSVYNQVAKQAQGTCPQNPPHIPR
jgi:uncharacterized membrane protein YheB (UPF0754 family)